MSVATQLPRPRFADPDRCPDCRAPLPETDRTQCPSCGLPLLGQTAADLFATLQGADRLLDRLRHETSVPVREWATPYPAPAARPAATRAPERPGGPGTPWTVPGVLLGLGALCLLIGAAVFLVVTWSTLGVGGRTAVLVGLTALAAVATWSAARHGLRAAAEALSLVTGAFVALDVTGGFAAGWFGSVEPLTALLLGSVAIAVALAAADHALATTPTGRLVVPQILSTTATLVAVLSGLARFPDHRTTTAVTEVVVLLGAALLARRAAQPVLAGGLAGAAGLAWTSLLTAGLADVGAALLDGTNPVPWPQVAPWLAAAALAATLAAAPRPVLLPALVRQASVVAASGLVGAAAAAALVTTPDGLVLLAAAGTLASAVLAGASPWRWVRQAFGVSALGHAAVALLPPLLTVAGLIPAVARAVEHERRFGDSLLATADPQVLGLVVGSAWTVPVGAASLALAAAALWPRMPRPATVLLVASWVAGTTLLCAVPSLLLAAGLAVVLAGLHLVASGRWETWWGADVDRGLAVVCALAGGWVTTYHPVPALAVSATYALIATVGAVRGSRVLAAAGPVLVAAAVATAGWLGGWAGEWTALATVAVVASHGLLVGLVGRLHGSMAGPARACGYLVALPTALLAGLVSATAYGAGGVDRMVAALVVTGVATAAVGILERRLEAAWVAAALQLVALWLRLAATDVTTAEAYTLPLAAVLLGFGAWTLWRDPETGSMTTLLPGLGAGLVPTLVLVGEDPVSLRALLLALACLAALVVGVAGRLRAPLLAGALTGAVLAVIEVAPYHDAVPRWLALGATGLVLLAAGVRWEHLAVAGRRTWGRLAALR